MRKNLRQGSCGKEVSHGTGDYVLCPREFPAESKMGSSRRARQSHRVLPRAVEKDRLRRQTSFAAILLLTLGSLGRTLQRYGLRHMFAWYEATRFTPVSGHFFE
jgi:hypothetical protein